MADHNATTITTTITTLEEWEAHKAAASEPLLLQCGSPQCVRCPDFTTKINVLKETFRFVHVYVNTHDCEESLLDDLQVTQLPAYMLVHNGAVARGQAATPQQIADAVQQMCPPALVLDDDF